MQFQSLITLGSGWHDLENHNSTSWRWTQSEAVIYVNNPNNEDILSFSLVTLGLPNFVKIVVNDSVEILHYEFKKERAIFVSIPLKDVKKISLLTNCVCPKDFDEDSMDTRRLGLQIKEFYIETKHGKTDTVPMYKTQTVQGDIPMVLMENSICKRDKFISFDKLEYDPGFVDKVTVVLTCHGNRVEFAEKALNSIIESKFKHCVIVCSGNNLELNSWAESKRDLFKILIITENLNNNQCWIKGVELVDTEYAIILHDDDLLSPNILKELSYFPSNCVFSTWNAKVMEHKSGKIRGNLLDYRLPRGVYSSKIIRNLLNNEIRSISPVRGCFKTSILKEALEKWEEVHGKDSEFFVTFTFVVGNDLFIWEYCTRQEAPCFIIPDTLTICLAHDKSATEINILEGSNKFENIYSKIKSIYISESIRYGVIMYSHADCPHTFRNLNDYKMSKRSIEFITYSDNPNLNFHIVTNPIPKMTSGKYLDKDKYAFWAFVDGIRIAIEKGWDYFFCYEWDCKVGEDYWLDTLWQQHLAWNHEPIMTGTPVLWYPKIGSGNFLFSANNYVHKYEESCNLAMNVEYHSPPALYCNGALTFYNTNKMKEYFNKELRGEIVDKSRHVDEVGPFDVCPGIKAYKEYGEDIFKRVGWLNSSYSGCGDYFYIQSQRDAMLETKLKVAVHQIKW